MEGYVCCEHTHSTMDTFSPCKYTSFSPLNPSFQKRQHENMKPDDEEEYFDSLPD